MSKDDQVFNRLVQVTEAALGIIQEASAPLFGFTGITVRKLRQKLEVMELLQKDDQKMFDNIIGTLNHHGYIRIRNTISVIDNSSTCIITKSGEEILAKNLVSDICRMYRAELTIGLDEETMKQHGLPAAVDTNALNKWEPGEEEVELQPDVIEPQRSAPDDGMRGRILGTALGLLVILLIAAASRIVAFKSKDGPSQESQTAQVQDNFHQTNAQDDSEISPPTTSVQPSVTNRPDPAQVSDPQPVQQATEVYRTH